MSDPAPMIPMERVAGRIFLIRGQKVMLDSDLAELYEVMTGHLNRAVKRNLLRFPEDFMFQLSDEEYDFLLCQSGIAKERQGGRRTPPYAFTEQGVAMLSSVLRSDRATYVNVAIMRAFVRMREVLATHKDVARKIEEHDHHIAVLYDQLDRLLNPPTGPKKKIGYIWHED